MTILRLLPLALLGVAPLAAQNVSHHTLRGSDVALYDLAGAVQVEAATGDAVTVDVTRGGADLGQLRIAEGELGGRTTLRVIYPGDEVRYPAMSGGSTELRVRDDGTFDDDDHGGRGRQVRISNRSGVEAWADLRVGVPAGRSVAVHLAVGKLTASNIDGKLRLHTANAPVSVNGARGGLEVEVGAGDVELTGTEGDLGVSTGSGRVQLTRAKGRGLSIETGSGDVAASALEADRLDIQTGSGDVAIDLKGDLDQLAIETGSGDIAITAPATLGARLEMETASGGIDSEFPLAVTRTGHDHLQGTMGDGKGRISVETGSGAIRLLKAK
jgi:lia operon protein LiaG